MQDAGCRVQDARCKMQGRKPLLEGEGVSAAQRIFQQILHAPDAGRRELLAKHQDEAVEFLLHNQHK